MLKRSEATQAVVNRVNDDTLMVASLGFAKYDLFKAKDRPRNFYMWNSMGMGASMALGMALAQPGKRVVVLQGDGDLLMNLGTLATEANQNPKNLIHVVWDNRMYAITGKQPTATAGKADLAAIAIGSGFDKNKVARVETLGAFEKAFEQAWVEEGPWFIHALITDDAAPKERPPKSPTFIKHRFMTDLGVEH